MLKYEKNLNVSKEEVYAFLLEQYQMTIKEATGKDVPLKELEKGYKYKTSKKVGKEVKEATVHIKKPEKYKKLSSTYNLQEKHYEMTYTITPVDNERITLTYEQITTPAINEGALSNLMLKRNCSKTFKIIEQTIQKRRNK